MDQVSENQRLLQWIGNETADHWPWQLSTCFQSVLELTVVLISKLNKRWRKTRRWELLNYFQLILIADILSTNLVSRVLSSSLPWWHWDFCQFFYCFGSSLCFQKRRMLAGEKFKIYFSQVTTWRQDSIWKLCTLFGGGKRDQRSQLICSRLKLCQICVCMLYIDSAATQHANVQKSLHCNVKNE